MRGRVGGEARGRLRREDLNEREAQRREGLHVGRQERAAAAWQFWQEVAPLRDSEIRAAFDTLIAREASGSVDVAEGRGSGDVTELASDFVDGVAERCPLARERVT